MNFNIKEIIAATMILFAVIDIVGNIPVVIKLRKKAGHIQSAKASFIALVIMIAFVFLGESILNVIGVEVSEFAVAGSFILFFIALEMILGITLFKDEDRYRVSIGFSLISRSGKFDFAGGITRRICFRKYSGCYYSKYCTYFYCA